MIPKYRTRGWIILCVSIALMTALLSVRRLFTDDNGRHFNRIAVIVWLSLACLYIYGCYTLIKAKGQSSALLLIAVPFICFSPFGAMIGPLAIAIATPDRFPQGNIRKRRRFWGWMERRRQN